MAPPHEGTVPQFSHHRTDRRASFLARYASSRMRRIGTAVIVVLVAGWLGFWFWPPSQAARVARLDSEITGSSWSAAKSQLMRSSGDWTFPSRVAVALSQPATAVLIADVERMALEQDREMVKAIDTRLARLRAQRSELAR